MTNQIQGLRVCVIHTNQKDAPVKIEQVHEHIDLHSDSFGSNHSVKDRDPRSRHSRQSFSAVYSPEAGHGRETGDNFQKAIQMK